MPADRHFVFCANFAKILLVKISAVIISFNEAVNIADAISSVSWADEILVVDSGSNDGTREISESYGAKVIVREWPGFSEQKQFAAESAENDWIFSLDADERVSEELNAEIDALRMQAEGNLCQGYRISRLSIYMNRPIHHCGWYPDRQLRLYDRRKGRWNGRVVHESVQMDQPAKVGRLSGEIIHYSVGGAAHHNQMIGERYAPLAAEQMFNDGRRTNALKMVFAAWWTFLRTYFLKAGFLDGFPGFCISYFAAHNTFLKHLILKELQGGGSRDQATGNYN